MTKAGQGVDRGEPFCTTAGNVSCCSPLREAYEGPPGVKTERHMIQQFHFWARIWRKWNHYVKEDICNNKSKEDKYGMISLIHVWKLK